MNPLASAVIPTAAGIGPDPAETPAGGAPAGADMPAAGPPSLFAELIAALIGHTTPPGPGGQPPGAAAEGAPPGNGLGLPLGADVVPSSGPPAASPSGAEIDPSDDVAPPAGGPASPLAEALAKLFAAVEALADPDAADADPETLVADAKTALDEFDTLLAGLGAAPGLVEPAPASTAAPVGEQASSLGAVQAAAPPSTPPATTAPVDLFGEPPADGPTRATALADPAEPAASRAEAAPGRLVRLAAHLNALAGRIDALAPDLAEALRALPARVAPLLNAEAPESRPGAVAGQNANPATGHAVGPSAIGQPAAPSLPAPAAEIARADTAPPPPSANADAAPLHLIARPVGGTGLDPNLAPDRPALAAGAPAAAPDMTTLAVEIARRFEAGLKRFHIRLDPPELGRIEVRLDIHGDRLAARLAVDRPETLDILQRDAKALERALAQTGLNGDRPSLEFTLKHNPFAGRQDDDEIASPWSADAAPANASDRVPAAAASQVYRGLVSAGGIDLYV